MSKTIKPRKSLSAFFLSCLMPGLGQLYNGSWNKASWFFLSFVFFSIPFFVAAVLYLPADWVVPGVTLSVFMCLFIWIYSILESTIDARNKKDFVPGDWQGLGVYLLVFVIGSMIAMPLLTYYVRTHLVEAYRIPSSSMEPTMVAGDFIFADKRYNCPSCKHAVQRGDVVVFTYPNNRNTNYIKRIIGLPGDRVQINGQVVKINGKTISKLIQKQEAMNVVQERSDDDSWLVVWKNIKDKPKAPVYDILVPNGYVFVLGDNRNASNDSRFFDSVPLDDVRAKARQIWLSYNKKLGGLRMDRSGKLVH